MNDNNLNTNENVAENAALVGHCAEVKSQPQSLTEQTPVAPTVITPGPVVVKVPVVLAETNITIPVEATIKLDKEALEIKRIRKNVYLNQSRLIPFSQDGQFGTGLLFISGFIRKNIEYATKTCSKYGSPNICGEIRHCTVEVPFNFTTRITFIRQPLFTPNFGPSELEFFNDKNKSCDACADPVIGRNVCDQSFFNVEFFNEKPFTELVRADIAEIDIHTDPYKNCKVPTEQLFTKLTEKIVVNLTLKVLQNQQVRVTALA
ncbi:hypothetical protein E5347_10755 [Clostridium sartagoforme]|uniref:DUF7852 domain-containing protein n=1 Tax=Clostridium sartagoforme TaxID=84031 RepID=A0A4S2DLE2_9CLOT|nr:MULTISPECIES: hypothetical protein [Clostridium]MBS5938637.1 hypothetical protein [Clostridium sp.]MBS5951439.1 hypothetical protein [Clostridium sp.]TGY41791.1 hypothetical protein E5347_10755 [Clostridium sartagoforme]